MASYYKYRRDDQYLGFYIISFGIIIAWISYEVLHSLETTLVIFFIFFYAGMLGYPKNFSDFILTFFYSAGIFLGMLLFTSWFLKLKISERIGIINDTQMLVFATFVYVYLTYRILQSNKEIFKLSRLPNLTIDEDFPKFSILNPGSYSAKNVRVNIELVYPIPHHPFFFWLNRLLNRTVYRVKNQSPLYMPAFYIEKLNPEESKAIDITEEFKNLIPVKVVKSDYVEEEGYISDDKILFDVIIDITYTSQDDFPLPEPIYNIFKYELSNTGLDLLYTTGKPLKLYS